MHNLVKKFVIGTVDDFLNIKSSMCDAASLLVLFLQTIDRPNFASVIVFVRQRHSRRQQRHIWAIDVVCEEKGNITTTARSQEETPRKWQGACKPTVL